MHADLESIVCKFGNDPTICLREEAICAKVYRQTDGRTDETDASPLIALSHSWNELKTKKCNCCNSGTVLPWLALPVLNMTVTFSKLVVPCIDANSVWLPAAILL